MTYPLRQLEANLQKVVAVATTEIEQDEGTCKGQYVFRDDEGHKFMWSPKPVRYQFQSVATVAEADHVMFLCPTCFAKNRGNVGAHSVMVTFANRNVPDDVGSRDAAGKPSRWMASGYDLNDLALTPSILLGAGQPAERGCHWHGFVGSSGIPPGHAG